MKNILVMDQDQISFETTVSYVARLGLKSLSASNLEDAKALIEQGGVDMIMSDRIELLNWCRAQGLHTPVLLKSGTVAALSDCCGTLLPKPQMSFSEFETAIKLFDQREHERDCLKVAAV